MCKQMLSDASLKNLHHEKATENQSSVHGTQASEEYDSDDDWISVKKLTNRSTSNF